MPKYRILEKVAYVKGNKAVTHNEGEDLVKLDADVAAELGDKVELRGESEPESNPESEPVLTKKNLRTKAVKPEPEQAEGLYSGD